MNNVNHTITLELPMPESRLRCIAKLVQRRLLSFYRDKSDLSITLLQPPLLALAFFVVFQNVITLNIDQVNLFQPLHKYLESGPGPHLLIFLAVLTAIWFGTSKAIAEIPSSQILYQQERLSFLKDFDYLLATFISLALIIFLQVLLFACTFHLLFVFLPAKLHPCESLIVACEVGTQSTLTVSYWQALMPGLLVKFMALLWLIAMTAIALAMLVSVFVKTRTAAVTTMTFVMIVQLLLGGSIVKPVIEMNVIVRTIAHFMPSRWGLEAGIILFDKELNLNLPATKPQEGFSFAKGKMKDLRKNSTGEFVDTLPLPPTTSTMQPLINPWWWDSLKSSAEYLASLSKEELSKEESEYLESLRKYQEQPSTMPDFPLLAVPERLLTEVRKQFKQTVQSKSTDVIANINRPPVENDDDAKWQAMLDLDPRLKLYRQPHAMTTWLMLVGLTLGFLTVTWGSFTRLNR